MVSIVVSAPDTLSPPPDAGVWGAVLLTALGATAFGFWGQTWAQAHLAPTRAAVVMTMEPVWAATFAVVLGGETLGLRALIGGALVLVAMVGVEYASAKPAADAAASAAPPAPSVLPELPAVPEDGPPPTRELIAVC